MPLSKCDYRNRGRGKEFSEDTVGGWAEGVQSSRQADSVYKSGLGQTGNDDVIAKVSEREGEGRVVGGERRSGTDSEMSSAA